MKKLVAYSEDAEVLGQTALSILASIKREHYQPILDRHQIVTLDPNTWYPQQVILDIMREIRDECQVLATVYDLVMVGIQVAEQALQHITLPDIETFFLSGAFRLDTLQRGEKPGYTLARLGRERQIFVEDHTPWPHDLMFGIYYGYGRVFHACGEKVMVRRAGIEDDLDIVDEYGLYEILW